MGPNAQGPAQCWAEWHARSTISSGSTEYQPSQRVTDDRPIAVSDGHDFPGLIDEGVPGVAAVIDDVVERFEDAVRQPVLAHELPDIFLAVKLGRARRQRQERDVARHLEVLGAVPAGLIEDDNRVGTRGDL